MLFVIEELYTNGYKAGSLDILSIIAVIFGILVILSKNPIVSVLFLIGLFLSIAIYLITLGINFIGLSYLLVYVGAVSILFLFILMLINVRISELLSNAKNSIALVILISVFFISLLYPLISDVNYFHNLTSINREAIDKYTSLLGNSNLWDGYVWDADHITSIGNVMFSTYSIWLILTSIILLLAMVGTIVITIKPNNI